MNNYVRYILHLEEPVKMGRQGNQSSTESLTYIAGSTLRGAFISRFISAYLSDVQTDLSSSDDTRKLLFTDTYFTDAYPCINGKGLLPMPSVYYADKHKLREVKTEAEEDKNKKLDIHCCLHDVPEEGEVRVGIGEYCRYEGDTIRTYNVSREANLHIRIGNNENESAMFRYEAIAEGQSFMGTIRCPDEKAAEKYCEAIRNIVVYLGGSRGSGYGRCKVVLAETMDYNAVSSEYSIKKTASAGQFIVYALSNLILLDENGTEKGFIPEGILESVLKVENVHLIRASAMITRTAGFNHTWKAGMVQRSAVSMGSVFTYECIGTPSEAGILRLEREGIGQRRQEGFGRVLINPAIECEHLLKYDSVNAEDDQEILLDENDMDMLKIIARRINESRIDTSIKDAGMDISDQWKKTLKNISATQKARLYNLLLLLETDPGFADDQRAAQRISVFIKKDLKNKSKESFKKCEIELDALNPQDRKKYSFLDLLNEIAERNLPHGRLNSKWDEVTLIAVSTSKPGLPSDFRLNCRLLKEVLYNLLRKEGDRP